MTKGNSVIRPFENDKDDMFIGWANAPAVDRRFLLGMMPLGLAGAGGLSWLLANELGDPGAGAWLTNETFEITGVLSKSPYPMMRIADPKAPSGVRTVLIVAQGKCTSALKLADADGRAFKASGALIRRKDRMMLEVPPLAERWLEPVDDIGDLSSVNAITPVSLGDVELSGSIMDSKCFFGVMRPGRGKTHKACASLCIRGGIPPSFWARSQNGRESVLLMTDRNGEAIGMDILPLVADPVSVRGELVQLGDIVQLRADPSDFRRI